jgi:hypothetical protein
MKVSDLLSGSNKRRHHRGPRLPRKHGSDLLSVNLSEGGHMDGVGAIHISEIKPTLERLERDLGIDLQNNVLGSVGKKQFSGDIDVAINISPDQFDEFKSNVEKSPIVATTAKGPLVLMSRVEIQNFNEDLETDKLRTGYVQVDYMMDTDPNWLKTFYHAPGETESRYKGAHRNIAIGALSQYVDRIESDEQTPDGRPLEAERYMFSSKQGLIRVIRRLKPKARGEGYTKSWTNEVIAGPWKTSGEIAKILRLGSAEDINSFETIFAAIQQNHPDLVQLFSRAIAADKSIQSLGVPAEIQPYL